MATIVSADKNTQIVSFNSVLHDPMNRGLIPVSLLVTILDVSLAMLGKSVTEINLVTIEGVLVILLLSIERQALIDPSQQDANVRHLSAIASPTLELIQNFVSKNKDNHVLIGGLLKELRRLTTKNAGGNQEVY